MDWLQTIKDDLLKARIIRLEGEGRTYDYLINPLSSGVPGIPTEALWGCAFEVARVANLRGADKILTPEAMGIQIGTALSLVTGIPMLIIRKRSYHLDGEIEVTKRTGYSTTKMYINSVHRDEKIVLVDSIIATGGTYSSLIKALQKNGVIIQDVVAVIERAELGGVAQVRKDTGVEVKTLVKVSLANGKVLVTN